MQFHLCIPAIQQHLCLLDDELRFLSNAFLILDDAYRLTIKDECQKELTRQLESHIEYVNKHIGWVKKRRQFLESLIELGYQFTLSEENIIDQLNKQIVSTVDFDG